MAVQVQPDKVTCPKCFALILASSAFCPECGASIKEGAEGSDTEVYNDLAKANLLRMRGNMKEAIDCCLGILRRYPNNVTAHTLLGDIYYEHDDLKQAGEWYEMALDLAPDSASEKLKLEKVKERLRVQEQSETVKQLGIEPARQPNLTAIVAGLVFALLCVAGLAFAIGRSAGVGQAKTGNPVTIAAQQSGGTQEINPGQATPAPTATVAEDEAILAILRGKMSPDQVMGAVFNPATANVVVTVVQSGTDPAVNAMQVISEVLTGRPDVNSVNVRVISNGSIAYIGRSTREVYTAARNQIGTGADFGALIPSGMQSSWKPGQAPVNATPAPAPTEAPKIGEGTGGETPPAQPTDPTDSATQPGQ